MNSQANLLPWKCSERVFVAFACKFLETLHESDWWTMKKNYCMLALLLCWWMEAGQLRRKPPLNSVHWLRWNILVIKANWAWTVSDWTCSEWRTSWRVGWGGQSRGLSLERHLLLSRVTLYSSRDRWLLEPLRGFLGLFPCVGAVDCLSWLDGRALVQESLWLPFSGTAI